MSLAQKFATTFGGVYVLVGIVGFISFFGGTTDQTPSALLGIFGVTAVHNVVHLLVGFGFLAGAQNDRIARLVSMTIGAVYTLVGVIGVLNLALVNDLLNINLADNLLHFATGLLALAVAFQGRRAAVTA
ncbi:MAG TPA: DUF4383 domain-containing protein [Actinomycetota bacterium]|jgi:hypothetical protein|nr:DUF4383 domain-containing protein [Actinomycetota bacterium]